MKDPEMGPVMLGKIKSQGVRELDDSAMIMRVKFKTIPGKQVTTNVDKSVKDFDMLIVGDSIHARYTKAISISVEKA